ncbi:hypothetical protein GDO86_010085 [Hymenochirus boettgeri]|uniref:Tumor necrosis factor ligand superfamily member 10 n=1 Tax=Hymenochirus boettgeri TaxID=247094 RepID=A0A8T2JN33_9PIPI|nr:hypothetical protein GDO86_010085 [Hymenochirus boettgeri]
MSVAVGSHPLTLCGLLLFAILLQSVFVAVTYVYFTNELKQLRETYIRSNFACLIGDDGDFSSFEDDYQGNDPCWEMKSQLQILIKKIILKNYKSDIFAAVKGKVPDILSYPVDLRQKYPAQVIAAHVTGDNKNAMQKESTIEKNFSGHKIYGWKSHRAPSFQSNVEIENGEIIIRKSGFYYIYSQTYFRQHENENTDKGKQLVQQIYKVTSYPVPILLMKNAKTSCWSKHADYGLHSIYQGGVFKLNEHDRIFVAVSDISMIDMDENATFFGAFMVV